MFSALSADVAGGIEYELAAAGLAVFTNAAPHRYDANVPIVIPHVSLPFLMQVIHYPGQSGAFGAGEVSKNICS